MKRAALWPPLAWLALFVAAPTFVIGAYSFYERELGRAVPALSLEAWRSVASADTAFLFGRSAGVGGVSTVFCLALGYPVAYFIAGCGPRMKTLLLALVVLPFWTNFLARTAALKLMLHGIGEDLLYTPGAVVLGLVYSYLPFMVLPLYVSIEKLPKRMLEAAADLGAGPAKRFWTVTVPLTAPGIAAGCLLVFVPCFGAFVTPAVLGGVGGEMLGTQIEVLAMRGNVPAASALGILMMAAVLALLGIYYRLRDAEGVV